MIRISDIKLGLDDTESDLRKKVMKKLGVNNVRSLRISKKSIDARRKPDIYYVYSVDVEADNEEKLVKKIRNAQIIEKKPYEFPKNNGTDKTIVIAGTGPAGLMCGLTLAQNGFKVILLERGKCAEDRKKDVDLFWETGSLNAESNVQFGEGGAGTFSDGKLTTGINDFRIQKVLEEFHKHGAPEEILYSAKPHVGTDNLYNMVISIREEIIRLGGEVRFSNKLVNIKTDNGTVCAAVVQGIDGEYEIETENIVLAIGHSARDTFEMLRDININMEQKNFSVGVRIEHIQEMINKSQYGKSHKRLGAADYKMSVHLDNGRGVYTFCMCPGGTVVASASEEGGVVTNGMSYFARDGKNANSALLVGVTPEDFKSSDPLAGMYFQREIEQKAFGICGGNYSAPCQKVGDFLGTESNKDEVLPTYRPGVVWTDMSSIFPEFIVDSLRDALPLMDNKLKGFADANAVMTGPETRSSSPVRLVRDKKTMQSNIKGLYPCGEGAGYAGGIMSAAVDGIKIAEMIAINTSK
ncbi:MAG: FAD-dependent oxidoreductase [Oscillospiraceae bacterium]|nr:FAD-dependent oxidoreductase [Oscillospiraceae bacterium]